jgi:asparagine synthase (glutamine-hydrolysing)
MSAIFGIIDFGDRPIDPKWIQSMQADLAHRGPDGQRIYQEESLFLGHQLLQVTPESIYEKSPYEEEGFIITANARLDEREAIMDRLDIPETDREVITDPLLLLRSFRKFGKDFVKDIYGDFAFAIWDKKKKELFCARDQIGIKPFLYYFEDNRFVFSTELKSIVNLPFVKTNVNNNYIRNEYFEIDIKLGVTVWENLYSLPAANYFTISNGNSKLNLYWTLRYQKNNLFNDLETSANALKTAIVQATEDRMKTIYNVGVPLSGGLDSSTIACVAARHSKTKQENIYSFSSMLDPKLKNGDESDESEYIDAVVAQETNIIAGYFNGSQLSYFRNMFSNFDRYHTISNIYTYVEQALYENFESIKVRRILSGHIGDMTVSNRSILPLAHLFRSGRFITLFRLGLQIKKRMRLSYIQLIKMQLLSPLSPHFIKHFWSWIKRKEFTSKNDLPIVLEHQDKITFDRERKEFYKKKYSNYNFKIEDHILPSNEELFREDFDTGSSHNKLEMTYPLMDRRILECLMKTPVEYFYADGSPRGLIKKAMKDYLPAKIRNRTDKGYFSPGFFGVIYKDIPAIIKQIELGVANNPKLNRVFKINTVLIYLKNRIGNKSYSYFSTKDWDYLYVCNWILYNIKFKKNEKSN